MPSRMGWIVVVLGVFSAYVGPAPAAGPEDTMGKLPRLFGTFQPESGVWSEYSVVEKDTNKHSKMRMAIVGKEDDQFWYEVLMDDGQNRNIIKMLVKGNPNDPDNIQRMIMKSGDNPATEMPRDFVAMGRKMAALMFERRSGVSADAPTTLRVEEGEEREVKVPAGTFKATQRRILDASGNVQATYEYAPEILPFGVVSSDTETTSMELIAHGKDAQSLITETPIPLSGPPGMPPGMPRGMPPGMKRPPEKSY